MRHGAGLGSIVLSSTAVCVSAWGANDAASHSALHDAESQAFASHVRHAALTAPAGTAEFGLLSAARFGVTDGVELSLHPLWFFVLPRGQVKVRLLRAGEITLSSRHEVSVPILFLNLLSRQGTGGLLDPTEPTPTSVISEHGALLTWRADNSHWLTAEPYVQWRIGDTGSVLDFPFLYQRFASLNSAWVAGARFGAEGVFAPPLGYGAELTFTHLPLESVPGAYAIEALVEARFLLSQACSLPVGVRAARAHFPIGVRTHWFPYIDLRLAW